LVEKVTFLKNKKVAALSTFAFSGLMHEMIMYATLMNKSRVKIF